jgi:hypothetical protein
LLDVPTSQPAAAIYSKKHQAGSPNYFFLVNSHACSGFFLRENKPSKKQTSKKQKNESHFCNSIFVILNQQFGGNLLLSNSSTLVHFSTTESKPRLIFSQNLDLVETASFQQ